MDFDDTELLTSNNNFDFHSFKDTNGARENNNGDFMGTFEDKIERLNTEKMIIQSRLNNKVVELQTQIVKMKNALEKSEMSKAEIEVEVTKVSKELRISQRQHNLKANEFEKSKLELTNHFKTLETEYVNQISHLNSMHRLFQEQVSEEKRNYQKNQESLCNKINNLTEKIKEKDKELSKSNIAQMHLDSSIKDQQSNIIELNKKVNGFEESNLRNQSFIAEQNVQLEVLKSSEIKLKGIIVDLNAKINQLESKNFEETHELNDSRTYQTNLQAQLLDLQQRQMLYEKEKQMMSEKISGCNRRIKELEESLNSQMKMTVNYREQVKRLENERDLQESSVNETNEELQSKIEELESKLQIQYRVIEEVNDEISSSRENESVAVCNLTKTLEELENYIVESPRNSKTQNTSPRFNKTQLNIPGTHCQSPTRTPRIDLSGDKAKPTRDAEYRQVMKNVMKNVKNTILNFRERINTLESDRLEYLEKLQGQDKEIKNLKSQIRRFVAQQKTLESENLDKQREIDNLMGEISNIKSVTSSVRQESGKNISNLKQTLNKTTNEYRENIEVRDNYLQSIAIMIKEALSNGISSIVDKGCIIENHGDSRRIPKPEVCVPNCSDPQNIIETSTQTQFIDHISNKDNLQLSGNLTGTFRFLNDNCPDFAAAVVDTQCEKRTHCYPSNSCDRKQEHQVNNNVDDKKRSSLKKAIKRTDSSATYVDSTKSWPALREVISSELVSLLNRYDIQRAQCQQLISELSAKENIITRLLSNQNSNSAQPHMPADSMSRCQQTSIHEPVVLNKSPNKASAFSQNNVTVRNGAADNNKKKPRTVLKPKLENLASNMSNKKVFKPENQKQRPLTQRLSTNLSAPTNKKATITSTKRTSSPTGSPTMDILSSDAQSSAVNISCAQRQIAISPQSTLPVTLRCPVIVDDGDGRHSRSRGQSPPDLCNTDDSCFVPFLLGILLRLIRQSVRLRTMDELVYFYKLYYHRSIDCMKLIAINNDLEKLIDRSSCHVSKFDQQKIKCRRFKVVVHVMTACQYMSRRLLASKLCPQVDSTEFDFDQLTTFLASILKQKHENNCPASFVDHIVELFTQFCVDNNCQSVFIDDTRRQHRSNKILTSSSSVVYRTLKKNIDRLKSMQTSQVALVKYKSKQKSYQTNLTTLMMKISELIHIIDGQNSVIQIREEEIVDLRERMSKVDDEKTRMMNLVAKMNTAQQTGSMEMEYTKLIITKTKTYLSKIMTLCRSFVEDELSNFADLLTKEESIYQSLTSNGCDDLIDCARDGIRMTLAVCGSVKSVII